MKNFNSSDKNATGNFVDDLVEYMKSKEAIEEAYFAFLQHAEENKSHLFLGLAHTGMLEEIQKAIALLKDKHYAEGEIHFASTEDKPELFDYIRQINFPFYSKSNQSDLNLAIVKQWFEPEKSKGELVATLRKSRVTALVENMSAEEIKFQHYTRNDRQFIPIFSHEEMVIKTGMSEIAKEAATLSFQWDEVVETALKGSLFILNPGSPFEVEMSL